MYLHIIRVYGEHNPYLLYKVKILFIEHLLN